jgi:hypothetical protein
MMLGMPVAAATAVCWTVAVVMPQQPPIDIWSR